MNCWRERTLSARTLDKVYTKLQQIATRARAAPQMVFTNLAHSIDLDFLRKAHRLVRKDGAAGVDRVRAQDYAQNLDLNLEDLLVRMRAGSYKAPPVKRVYIPKDDKGNTRPIGIPTFEDKIAQKSAAMVLESVYEQDFLDCSYGFRPGRSQHQALGKLRDGLMDMNGGWVLEVDIRSFFDTLNHQHLRDILDRRVRDKGIRRLIGKWLKAGVMEGLEWRQTEAGTPQGGVISALLSNIYLHEVLDRWFHETVLPRLRGKAFLVRFADDWVAVFSDEKDARRVLDVIPKRFGRYGLEVHDGKTRLSLFPRPPRGATYGCTETFDFLGFTHYWGKSRKGAWIVKKRTAKARLRRALLRIKTWCQGNRHCPVREQHQVLCQKVQGHYGYYGVTHNMRAIQQFALQVGRLWCKWLSRRSRKARLNWEAMNKLLKRYPLPRPIIVHSVFKIAASH